MSLFFLATATQGLVILIDEFYFHHRRGLPRWERIGHPLDSLTVFVCLLFLVFMERTPTTEIIYYILAVFSCAFVTKDEWIHRRVCTAEEMWLHAVLFIAHPLVLFSAMAEWEAQRPLILAAAGGVLVFIIYQVAYWNFIASASIEIKKYSRHRETTQEDLYEYFGE